MNILLTFTGFRDPYALGLVDGEEQPGPILSLLAERAFDRVFLLSTPNTREATDRTVQAIAARTPKTAVETHFVPLYDPTDYRAILRELKRWGAAIVEKHREDSLYVAVASGTPQMHACWVLLVAAGEIPARVLHVRPPQFVSEDCPAVVEVDLAQPEFPHVRAKSLRPERTEDLGVALGAALEQLGIVGDHPGLQAALERAALAAPTDISVLLRGETGTGKELFAQLIHRLSDRANRPFVSINCGAIPRELVESTLFGHARGAFTGATHDRKGKFEEAHGGTLFLDELFELPRESQVKMLRVVEDGMVEPVGAGRSRRVDVRVIAASNREPHDALALGEFRRDLYHRLAAVEIVVPPLRERVQDIPKLALYLLDRINTQLRRPKRLTAAALARLQRQPWPGNVRDLKNTLTRSAMFCREDVLDENDLYLPSGPGPDPFAVLPEPHEGFELKAYLDEVRRRLIRRALELSGGSQTRAAQLLGVTPQAVHKFVTSESTPAPAQQESR